MGTRAEYVEIIKSAFFQMGLKVAKEKLFSFLPKFLTSGIIGVLFNPFVNLIIEKTLSAIIESAEMLAFFAYIDLRTSRQGREFYEAAKANRDIQRSEATPEEKINAENNLKLAFKNLAKWTT